MSLYDTIKVKEDVLDLPEGEYQTKSLHSFMNTYHLDNNGKLILEVGHYEDSEEIQDWYGKVLPVTKFVLDGMKDVEHHGWITVYGSRPETDMRIDFHLKFIDGNLAEVRKKIWVVDENGDWKEDFLD